jgi:hypothetical protein
VRRESGEDEGDSKVEDRGSLTKRNSWDRIGQERDGRGLSEEDGAEAGSYEE